MEVFLNLPTLVLDPLFTCMHCMGKGWEWMRTDVDEWDKDVCRFCDGDRFIAVKPHNRRQHLEFECGMP